jgi:hypothetical protein
MRARCLPGCLELEKNRTSRLLAQLREQFGILLLFLLLALSGCTFPDQVDERNFAVDTYSPNANETQLALQRAQRYWQKNWARFSQTKHLAVATTRVLQGDIWADLYPKINSSETTASYFSQSEDTVLDATCIMI